MEDSRGHAVEKDSMSDHVFTAYIEKDPGSGIYYGYIPDLPGAHSQAETLDELQENLQEVASLCIEELDPDEKEALKTRYVGTQRVQVAV
jgi:predicted RNase H-like HicB family nuclease